MVTTKAESEDFSMYETTTNEELVRIIRETDSEDALAVLLRNIAPITMHEAEKYRGRMATYQTEDFLQEGTIVAWQIIERGTFRTGNFCAYFGSAVKKRFANIYRDYTLRNLICIEQRVDCYGNLTSILAVSDYAKAYREKHRRHCRESYARKKEKEAEARRAAGIPDPELKPVLSEEEKLEQRRTRALAYYHEHKDDLNARRKAKRDALKLMAAV